MVRPVAIALTVRGVVFDVVGNQIPQREAIVCGNEVHRGIWSLAIVHQILRARNATGKLLHPGAVISVVASLRNIGQPKLSDRIAIAVVPLGEADWEITGLPAAHANVPRFNN